MREIFWKTKLSLFAVGTSESSIEVKRISMAGETHDDVGYHGGLKRLRSGTSVLGHPLGRPLVRSHRLLAPHCSLRLRSLVCSLARSLTPKFVGKHLWLLMSQNQADLHHSGVLIFGWWSRSLWFSPPKYTAIPSRNLPPRSRM